ncbi:FG-GAP-like repeat-containing protein [Streptosporangium sp. NPDC006013]|uniref:FG-GAP-like repeat-containing protein n=1 Tax=Streptosporangium sp. NPDC006013 TaxID=3155596 RepID=UPI0033BDE2D7
MSPRIVIIVLAAMLATGASLPPRPVRGDVNGDGGADLVVGGAGLLTIQPLKGRAAVRNQHATALSTGDFDKDGLADVAVGTGGTVTILYGRRADGHVGRSSRFTPGQGGVPRLGTGHGFGNALTTSDFNRDGYADLAVGAPETTLNTAAVRGGAAVVLYGSRRGLTSSGALRLSEDTPGVVGFSQHSRLFGAGLAAGDVTGDGYSDLVVTAPSGRPGYDIGGAIHVFKGSARGVTITGNTMVTSGNVDGRVMDVQACAGGVEGADNKANTARCTREPFGWSVRVGRFHGGKYADVIAGIGTGRLLVLRGGPVGVDKRRLKTLALPGIAGTSDPANDYAGSLAAGDVDKDGYTDLVAGARGRGEVAVLYGSAAGPRRPDWIGKGGANVALLDVDGDTVPELATTDGDSTRVFWIKNGRVARTIALPLQGRLIAR